MNSLNEIWESVIQVFRQKLTPTSVTTWFADCEPVDLVDNCLVLKTTTDFKRSVIEARFGDVIRETLSDLFSCEFDFKLLVGDELEEFRAARKSNAAMPEMDGYTFENFIVGTSNRFAHAAAISVAKEPGKSYNPLMIYGNSGLGKTHLLLAIGQYIHEHQPEASIAYIKGDEFTNQMVNSIQSGKAEEFRQKYRNVDLFLVDDIQFIAGKESTQEEFFHTFNNIYEAGHQIVITSDRPPVEMTTLDDRLRTRFEWGLLADIQPPDYETRMAILKNKTRTLGLDLGDDVCNYIAINITNNVRQIEGVVKKLMAYRDLDNMPLDLPNVSKVIEDSFKTEGNALPTPALVISQVCKFYSIDESVLRGTLKKKNVAEARQMAMYLIRNLTNLSLPDIGKEFGRDHSTVLYAIRRVETAIKAKDKVTQDKVRDITANINSSL